MLFDYLNRVDLWEKNIEDSNFEKEYFNLSKLKITVGEGYHFYKILGGDSQLINLNIEDKDIGPKNNNIDIEENMIDNYENKNRINLIEDEDEEEEEINTNKKKKKKYGDEDDEDDEEKRTNEGAQKKKQRRKLF